MSFKQGTIEAISIKPLHEPDQYGNQFRASLKIGEDWISYGALKKDSINIKTGDEWVQLQKGMEVEFMYTQNGDWKNIQKKSFSILNTDTSTAPSKPAPKKGAPPKKSYVPQPNVNPAEVGQCLNLSAEVLGLSEKELLDKDKVSDAIRWYKQVRELFTELYPSVEAEAPKPKKKEEPEPVEDDYDDEDI